MVGPPNYTQPYTIAALCLVSNHTSPATIPKIVFIILGIIFTVSKIIFPVL